MTQFNIYLMCGEEEDTLEKYKKEILPAFKGAVVSELTRPLLLRLNQTMC